MRIQLEEENRKLVRLHSTLPAWQIARNKSALASIVAERRGGPGRDNTRSRRHSFAEPDRRFAAFDNQCATSGYHGNLCRTAPRARPLPLHTSPPFTLSTISPSCIPSRQPVSAHRDPRRRLRCHLSVRLLCEEPFFGSNPRMGSSGPLRHDGPDRKKRAGRCVHTSFYFSKGRGSAGPTVWCGCL